MKPIVVLGSGLAGYTLVRELRKLNREIPITLISRDSGDYYSKPMLSNAFAQGKDAASLVLTTAAEMAAKLGITLLAKCEVSAIDRTNKTLDTTAGIVEYDRLVLALGADPIRIPLPGDAADAVLSVNDLSDYAQLRERLATAKSVVIMGAGLIGCEFANDLAVEGYTVSVIDPGPYPLASLMPEQAGGQLLKPLADLGVAWRFGTAVQRVDKALSGYALTLTDGAVIHADLVLSAIGLRPRIQLAREAGLEVNRGIVVNECLRSSDEAIFALGDCAEIEGRVLPFVLPIMHAGRALAKVLNGEDAQVDFPAMPVVVKTPAHPVAVSPVARDAPGAWRTLATGDGISMGFFDPQDRMTGFVLTGVYAGERNEMAKKINI
ncbi:MAG: FAD-dependent oxidoreductase [Gallionella sp.]|nr:FAD-dependent oxidoreductase [Gallionella sp.]